MCTCSLIPSHMCSLPCRGRTSIMVPSVKTWHTGKARPTITQREKSRLIWGRGQHWRGGVGCGGARHAWWQRHVMCSTSACICCSHPDVRILRKQLHCIHDAGILRKQSHCHRASMCPTWCGSAEDRMSKSFGVPPSRRSRTVPPTTYTSCPAAVARPGKVGDDACCGSQAGSSTRGARSGTLCIMLIRRLHAGLPSRSPGPLAHQALHAALRSTAPHLQPAGATAPARQHAKCLSPGWGGRRPVGYALAAAGTRRRCCMLPPPPPPPQPPRCRPMPPLLPLLCCRWAEQRDRRGCHPSCELCRGGAHPCRLHPCRPQCLPPPPLLAAGLPLLRRPRAPAAFPVVVHACCCACSNRPGLAGRRRLAERLCAAAVRCRRLRPSATHSAAPAAAAALLVGVPAPAAQRHPGSLASAAPQAGPQVLPLLRAAQRRLHRRCRPPERRQAPPPLLPTPGATARRQGRWWTAASRQAAADGSHRPSPPPPGAASCGRPPPAGWRGCGPIGDADAFWAAPTSVWKGVVARRRRRPCWQGAAPPALGDMPSVAQRGAEGLGVEGMTIGFARS